MSDQLGEQMSGKKEQEQKNPIRVLIVEDGESLIPVLEAAFKMAGGFETAVVEKTEDALRVLRDSKVANKSTGLVFSDLGLGDDDEGGYRIAEAVRDEHLADYFILFTGKPPQINNPQQLEKMGINKVIAKPPEYKKLLIHLNEAKEAIRKPKGPQQ